jgi:hypothetical protein
MSMEATVGESLIDVGTGRLLELLLPPHPVKLAAMKRRLMIASRTRPNLPMHPPRPQVI